jgi:hypothetical protein
MKHIRDYEKFNEEFLGSLLNAAKGAFKNFLTGISVPFKTLGDDFKKGLQKEELKKKMTTTLDSLLKTATDSINKAEDESALNQIVDQFKKEFDEKCAQIDKEIKTVKESNSLILESAIKDGMIMGRVLLGMVRQKATEIKMEFDKKVAAAKDLASKKAARISEIKALVDDFKKKIVDDKYLDEQVKKYKEENKIESTPEQGGNIVLDWGDVEIEIKKLEGEASTKHPGYLQVVKSGSKKLIVAEGQEVLVKISGEIKKGDKVKLTDILRNGQPDPMKEYETGALERILNEKGEEVDSYKFEGVETSGQEDLVKKLGELKAKKPDEIKRVSSFVDFVSKDENKPKLVEIEKIMNT